MNIIIHFLNHFANAMQKNTGAGAAGGATTTVVTTLDAAAPAEEDSEANPE